MFILSLVPTIVIFALLWIKKWIKNENVKQLIKIFMLGILSIVITLIFGLTVLDLIRSPFDQNSVFYIFLNNILLVGFVEESSKYIFVRLGTRKANDSNDQMAMIVYAVTVALAFATIENIFYLEDSNIVLAIARALLTVPNHAAYGVIMGYNLAISRRSVKALFIPTLIHGVIDGVLDLGRYSWLFVLVGIGLTIANYVYAIKLMKKAKTNSDIIECGT